MKSAGSYPSHVRIPKIIGFDTELMNLDTRCADNGLSASRALMREVTGVSANCSFSDEQDAARVFLPGNGASVYIDLQHLELAGPECRSAWDFVAQFHGMLGIARAAMNRCNLADPGRYHVHANNTDGSSSSWGGHMSILVSRTAFEWLFRSRPGYLPWLASAQASSIILTGAGKVGSENDHRHASYQISQRSDFYHVLSSIETTRMRPLVNTRDESHGTANQARLHCIFHDTTLCHGSLLMKAGLMQILLAMIEAAAVDPRLRFEDPLAAVHDFSKDPTLRATARLEDGTAVTALEHQELLWERAADLMTTDIDALVPGARSLLDLWRKLLIAFRADDQPFLARHLDWVAKRTVLERAASRGIRWDDPRMKQIDFAWSSLGPDGIYQEMEAGGVVKTMVDRHAVDSAPDTPPPDTRAYIRAWLLRKLRPLVTAVDWNGVSLRGKHNHSAILVPLPDPLAGRQTTGDLAACGQDELLSRCHSLWPLRSRSAPVIFVPPKS